MLAKEARGPSMSGRQKNDYAHLHDGDLGFCKLKEVVN